MDVAVPWRERGANRIGLMSIRAEMLGTARVVLADGTVRPLKPTARDHALVYLALTGDWVTRDRLGFFFWADDSDSTARHNVRQLLKRIRQLMLRVSSSTSSNPLPVRSGSMVSRSVTPKRGP